MKKGIAVLVWMLLLLPFAAYAQRIQAGELMDIYEVWDMEDARAESEDLIISAMYRDGMQMGLDRESMTFFCTLGMDQEEWPAMTFEAEGAENLQIVWLDDYTYDSPADAVRDQNRYELVAFDDTSYCSFGVVFTGLPMVIIDTDDAEIPYHEDIAATAEIEDGTASVASAVEIHQRGSGYDHGIDKWSYKIELKDSNGKKRKESILGMPSDDEWVLLANATDVSCIRNIVCWDLWNEWVGENGPVRLQNRLTEVFLNDEYIGIYQLGQPIDAKAEIVNMGGNLDTDLAVRKMQHQHPVTRPVYNTGDGYGYLAELRYSPKGMSSDEAFEKYQDFFLLDLRQDELTDEEFTEMAERMFDVESLMQYFLYIQVCSVGLDNVRNNVWIWAFKNDDGSYTYRLTPWDMDCAFQQVMKFEDYADDQINMWMLMINRMLNLNIGGSRGILHRIWNEKRESTIVDDAIYSRMQDYAELLINSGAYARETQRWRGGAMELNITEMQTLSQEHLSTIERYMDILWPEEETESAQQTAE